MLKGIRKIMTFLLTLAVVLSFICQTDPQIFAQSPDVTDDEAEVAVQSDETALPEDEQTAEEGPQESKEAAQEEVTKEETQEETPVSETTQMQDTDADEHQGMVTKQETADSTEVSGNAETSSDEAGSVSVQTILIDPETHFTVTAVFTEQKINQKIRLIPRFFLKMKFR